MNARALALLLFAAAAARADQAWTFEPGQALVSVEVGPAKARISATSLGLSGRVNELGNGAVHAEIRVALASFAASARSPGQQLKTEAEQFPEIVFEGGAPSFGKNGTLQLAGTLTFHGVSRPLALPVTVVRAAGLVFGHATLALHLRDYGFALPAAVPDEVRIEVDAGLRPEGVLVTRG